MTKPVNNRIPNRKSEKILFPIIFVLFVFYAIYLMFPIAYGFMISLMENGRAYLDYPVSIPSPMHFKNYIQAFSSLNLDEHTFFSMTINSLWYAVGGSFLSLVCPTCVGYVVNKYKFRGRKFIYSMVVFIMMLPIYGTLPSQYKLFYALGFFNSPAILLSKLTGFNSTFLLIYAFFAAIPWEIAEAAFVDGASNHKVFLKVMLPMVLPSISILFITGFISSWNDYMSPLLYLNNMPTLAAGLYSYERKIQFYASQPLYFAGAFISLIPVLILFISFQETILTKVHLGALKG